MRSGKLKRLSMMELLDLWSKNLKKAFKVVNGKILNGDKIAYKRLSEIDDEIKRREGGFDLKSKVGYRRQYNKKERKGFRGKYRKDKKDEYLGVGGEK